MPSSMTFSNFQFLAETYDRIGVYKQSPLDRLEAIHAYRALSKPHDASCLIELGASLVKKPHTSFLGFNPYFRVTIEHGNATVIGKDAAVSIRSRYEVFNVLQQALDKYRFGAAEFLPKGLGGLVGFLAYGAVRLLEEIPDQHPSSEDVPDLFFQLYQTMLVFDHVQGILTIMHVISKEASYEQAMETIDEIAKIIQQPLVEEKKKSPKNDVLIDVEDEEFRRRIAVAKDYLLAGDIFQVVLSRCFTKPIDETDPLAIYETMRRTNPTPYLYFLNLDTCVVVGASPERLIRVTDGLIETMPIAGTRPVSATADFQAISEDLLNDRKENAEHMMLVDLARNDLGSVSQQGTIVVKKLKTLERFSRVVHLVSEVNGTLKPGCTSIDALKAAFPAGTLTGAPKIRAMEIIDELESSRRGLYGGAICVFDFKGNLESWLAIRTAVIKDGIATVRAGAGIVLDSDPYAECLETYHKASGVLDAIDEVAL